jgi:quinol monooxygenase YgiN
MYTHAVMLTVGEHSAVTAEEAARLLKTLEDLVPSCSSVFTAVNRVPGAAGASILFIGEYESAEAYEAYRGDERHLAMHARLNPNFSDVRYVDFHDQVPDLTHTLPS